QVVVRRGRETAKVQLSPRFQEAVDRAAMRAGRGSSNAYLADWKRSDPRPCGDDIQAEAAAEAARIEASFSYEQLEEPLRPKDLRNGPCGGVRANGHCEVRPEMKCVWLEAVTGAARSPGGMDALQQVQVAVDRRLEGRSSWLRAVRQRVGDLS